MDTNANCVPADPGDKKWDNAVSFVRMIAVAGIILTHFCQYYGNALAYWFNGFVQVFLFISGWLYGKKTISRPIRFIGNNFQKILLDYWIYLLIVSPVIFILEADVSLTDFVYAFLGSGVVRGLGHFWFVPYILVCYFLTPYLYLLGERWTKKSIVRYMVRVGALCLAVIVLGRVYHSYFQPAWIVCYIAGFFLSKVVSVYRKVNIKRLFLISFPFAVLMTAGRVLMEHKIIPGGGAINQKLYNLTVLCGKCVMAATLFFGLYLLYNLLRLDSCKIMQKILRFSDRYSYQIYICHAAYISSCISFLKCGMPLSVAVPAVLLCTCISAVALNKICFFIRRHIREGYNKIL